MRSRSLFTASFLAAVTFACLSLTGCNKAEQAPAEAETVAATAESPVVGTVAVIDLDGIARRLGRDVDMANAVKKMETSLNQQLQAVQASYKKQLNEKYEQFGESLTEEQAQLLASMKQQATVNLNDAARRAQTDLSQHRLKIIGLFREEVKPIAKEVAAERGLSIIVTRNDMVIYAHDSAVDITDEVIERMLARQAVSPVSPPTAAGDRVATQPDGVPKNR